MPSIEQYDWDKLRPKQPERFITNGLGNWTRKPKPNTIPIKHRGSRTTKIKDKRLFNDIYDQDQHLRSID